MLGIQDLLGIAPPWHGLEPILEEVASGRLSTPDAATQIRRFGSQSHLPSWVPVLFILVGGMFASIGIGLGCVNAVFSIGTTSALGTVTKLVGDNPVVSYNVKGREFTVQGLASTFPPAYFVGDKVTVLYRPTDPSIAQVNTFVERILFPLAFAVGGTWSMICGYCFPWVHRYLAPKMGFII